MHGQGSGQNLSVTDFVGEKIALEMKKLGLESLLPNLLQSMYDEYKQRDIDISVEDFAKMQVGELRRNMKARKVEALKSKVETVITCNNGKATVENDERMVV